MKGDGPESDAPKAQSGTLERLLSTADIPLLVLDPELRIIHCTPHAAALLGFEAGAAGRPLGDAIRSEAFASLPGDAERALIGRQTIEREFRSEDGRWLLARLVPSGGDAGQITGLAVTFLDVTDRKTSESELRLAKEFSEHIIEILPEPLLALSLDLEVRMANAAFYEHFGVNEDETLGRSLYDLGNGQWDIPLLRQLLEHVLPANETFRHVVVEQQFPGLGRRMMRLNGRRIDRSDLILLAIADVTEQHEALVSLQQSEDRLQRMIAIEGIGVLVFDTSGTVIDANNAFLQMSGYGREDVDARRLDWKSLTAPAHRQVAEQAMETLRRTGGIGPREKEYLHKDGSSSWVLFVGADLGDGQLVEFCIDISDRKRIEAQLEESREQLEEELNSMTRLHDLVARLLVCKDSGTALNEVLDASMQIVATELGAAHVLDDESEALVLMAHTGFGRAVPDWLWRIPIEAPLACAQAVRERRRIVVSHIAAGAGGGSRSQFALGIEDGPGAIQSTPLIGRSGETVGVLSTYYSRPEGPTERELRFLDLYARQAADFIEHVRYRDAANLASRRKDEFLATLAHELRNPLAPISMGLELLRARTDDPSVIEDARRTMRRQLDQLIALVDDLLDVSRISRGMLSLKMRDIDIRDVVVSAVEEVRPAIDKAGHTLHVNLPDGPIQIAADPHRLAQVLSNLLSNAAKFTPPGGSIEVGAHREDKTVVLTVTDNGIGIAPGMTQRIFEMFGQIDRTRAQSGGGLGIGLTLVKSLTELHGGTVDVESAGEGHGATFTVRLPVPLQTDLIEQDHFPDESDEAQRLRVLVVDDSKPAADLLAMVLETLGHEVSTAYDGQQATQMAEAFRPDAVIMDIGMPTLDGYATARLIRNQPWGEHLTLIALTGRSRDADRKRSREAGFDHHLVKPVKANQLRKVLSKARRNPEPGL